MGEPENTSDDAQWWQIIHDVIEDFAEQEIKGSAVLLIVTVVLFAVYAPSVFGLIMAWINRNKAG